MCVPRSIMNSAILPEPLACPTKSFLNGWLRKRRNCRVQRPSSSIASPRIAARVFGVLSGSIRRALPRPKSTPMAGTSGTPKDYPAPTVEDKPPAARGWWSASRLLCRYALACVFLMAAITKITDLRSFITLVQTRSGLPHQAALAIGCFLPWLELTCGGCLLLGKATREAGLILAVLLIGLLAYSLTHLGEPDCG